MDKRKIESFAVNARNKLRQEVIDQLRLIAITEDEIKESLPQSDKLTQYFDIGVGEPYSLSGEDIEKRENLINDLNFYIEEFKSQDSNLTDKKVYKKAFDKLVEEAAYTWFNRLIALRFLEVNDFLPGHVRVLSSTDERREPEIINYPYELDIEFSQNQLEEIEKLKNKSYNEELYKLLILELGHRLNKELPFLFGENKDYYDLLFPLSYSNQDSVLNNLISQIPEEDFDISQGGQVEILGWLYQFYNSELKDKVYADLKKNIKINKETLPVATQIFTPDWIVKYMVENTLGRLWINHLLANDKNLDEEEIVKEFKWNYYIPTGEQSEKVEKELGEIREKFKDLTPEEITFLDPAMGSGHILSYAFELLMQIYVSEGYRERDAAKLILEKNLFGLDVDKRASQIAEFALLMKARQFNRRIFRDKVQLNLFEIPESNGIDLTVLDLFGKFLDSDKREELKQELTNLLNEFENAKLVGSLLKFENYNYQALREFIKDTNQDIWNSSKTDDYEKINQIIKVANILTNKFDTVVTNPPYMGSRYYNPSLKKYIQTKFEFKHNDLFSAFIERSFAFTVSDGYISMIIQPSLISLSSFEKLRKRILEEGTIQNLLHMGRGNFGIDFGSVAFEIEKSQIKGYKGEYFRLHQKIFQFIHPEHIEKIFLTSLKEPDTEFDFSTYDPNQFDSLILSNNSGELIRFQKEQDSFNIIPGSPIAYWISDNLLSAFENGTPLGELADSKQGLATTDNKRFLRQWFEVENHSIEFNSNDLKEALESQVKWFPYNKGGEYRKWYGNNDYIVNWENNGKEIKENVLKKYTYLKTPDFVVKNTNFYFKPSFSWSLISSGAIGFRYKPKGHIFDVGGMSLFSDKDLFYFGALCNSKIANLILEIIAPTINYQCGDIAKIPVIIDESKVPEVEELVKENIKLSKADWDSFETSWNFKKHPLVRGTSTIEKAYQEWEREAVDRFNKLKKNEEELNRIFIDIYNMNSELSPEVEDKYVSVRKADREREIKSLLSYAVGCILGRYSLDEEGLILAGGKLEEDRYKRFKPDVDGVIPILDQAYFIDDIMDLLSNWLKVVYGDKTLEENLDYIAESLGRRGNKSLRDVIREYFLKNFITDHNREYRKRPIYWLYDSGRNNGFKALIYQHRYDEDTTGRIAADYLKRTIEVYSSEIDRLTRKSEELKESGDAQDKREARAIDKQIEKLRKQLTECRDFNEKVQHLANLRISIDLDDGVLVNHAKIQTDENGKNLKLLKRI